MPRGRKATLSIPDLERMLEERRSAVAQLQKKRDDLQAKVAELDLAIAAAGGSVRGAAAPVAKARRGRPPGGGRAKNAASLGDSIAAVMQGKGTMAVGEILDAVLASGYRSTSENFRGIVNQTLIKDGRFKGESRGNYVMK
jgi:hypothetical protein